MLGERRSLGGEDTRISSKAAREMRKMPFFYIFSRLMNAPAGSPRLYIRARTIPPAAQASQVLTVSKEFLTRSSFDRKFINVAF